MKTLFTFFIILFFVGCNYPLFTAPKPAPRFDEESKQLKEEYMKGVRKKCSGYLYATLYDTIGINRYAFYFCKENSMFSMTKYTGQRWDGEEKEKFNKFYYGTYNQNIDSFFITFIKVKPNNFSTKLYYTSTGTKLIFNDNGVELKLHIWKHNFDFHKQNVKPRYRDYTEGLFKKRR